MRKARSFFNKMVTKATAFLCKNQDGAINYILEIACVTVVIILIITTVVTKFDFTPIWNKITDSVGAAIDKATAAFN